MNAGRVVSLAAAVLITAAEWAAFSSLLLLVQPNGVASVPAVQSASDTAVPEIVVTAHREHALPWRYWKR